MSELQAQLYSVITKISDEDAAILLNFINRFVGIADDIATEEDLRDIHIAKKDYQKGNTIPLSKLL